MNVRAFSLDVKQKANSAEAVSKETVLKEVWYKLKKKVTMGGDLPLFSNCHCLQKIKIRIHFNILSKFYKIQMYVLCCRMSRDFNKGLNVKFDQLLL